MELVLRHFRSWLLLLVVVFLLQFQFQFQGSHGQQTYVDNKQLDCHDNDPTTFGYVCNGAASSCASYITFRSSNPSYNTPAKIATLLGSQPSEIATINNISSITTTIPQNTLLIVPIKNCSCSSSGGVRFYQHNASYVLTNPNDNYFTLANNTYQGLTTCQSLKSQNPYDLYKLELGMNLTVPLRCACPTSNQTAAGFKYLLAYLITWYDYVEAIASRFHSDTQSILDANEFSSPDKLIYPFTSILVPIKTEPTIINISPAPPPPPPSALQLPAVQTDDSKSSSSSQKWVFVGVGVGAVFLLFLSLSGFLVWFFRHGHQPPQSSQSKPGLAESTSDYTALTVSGSKMWSVSSEGVRYATESLMVYKFEQLEKATGFFGEANRIKGSSVYRGSFNGDAAAVKIVKGDVSAEINTLKQIIHPNIIRLSGFCLDQGNTYLVYEHAENGSLSEGLHHVKLKTKSSTSILGWKQRVQIAYDVANGLNYLHNLDKAYIHMNIKSSNVLLDNHLRAKIVNFGLARRVEENHDESLQLTRHVIGTYGYMAPEYIENGLITPKMDVFALGVVMLELLSGREAARTNSTGDVSVDNDVKNTEGGKEENEDLQLQLSATIMQVFGREKVREKLAGFMDPSLENEYPLDMAYSMAELARNCVDPNLNYRPSTTEVSIALSKILSSLDWDPSDELDHSKSLSLGR